jgi:hypothetical protein
MLLSVEATKQRLASRATYPCETDCRSLRIFPQRAAGQASRCPSNSPGVCEGIDTDKPQIGNLIRAKVDHVSLTKPIVPNPRPIDARPE